MKKTLKIRFITIFTALTVCFSALFGLLNAGKTAFADELTTPVTSKLEISTDFNEKGLKELTAGTTFNIILRLSTTYPDAYWSSITTLIGPLNEDGSAFDLEIAKKLKVVHVKSDEYENEDEAPLDIDFGTLNTRRDYSVTACFDRLANSPNDRQRGSFYLGIRRQINGKSLPSDEDINIKVPIEVTEDIVVESVTFGVTPNGASNIYNSWMFTNYDVDITHRFSDNNLDTDGIIEVNKAVIQLKPEEYLIGLEAGLSESALHTVDITQAPASIVLDDSVTQLYVKPVFAECSFLSFTSRIGTDKSASKIRVDNNQTEAIPVPSGSTKLIINVYDGVSSEPQTYEVELVFVSVRLNDLAVTAGDADMTALGLQKEFDKDSFAYGVKVPDSTCSAQITASVAEDGDTDGEITLSAEGCTVTSQTVNSGSAFTVSSITAGAKLTLTVKSKDGEFTKNYVLNFSIVSTDTSIKSLNVKYGESVYNNDSNKAEENSCDYYFTVEEGASYGFSVSVADSSTYKLNAGNADGSAREYKITVTSEAGNSREYKVIVATQSVDSGSNTSFDILKVVDFVAVEHVAVNTISCLSFPLRIISIIIWDIIVPIFG